MDAPNPDKTPEVLYHLTKEVERLEKLCIENAEKSLKNDRRLIVIETRNALWGLIAGGIAGTIVTLLTRYLQVKQ